MDYNIAIKTNSALSIAPVSQQFTAACIALLIMNGKRSLDDPASNFLPHPGKCNDTIRVKHLIYDTSGLTDYYRLPRLSGTSWITFNYCEIGECIETSLAVEHLTPVEGINILKVF